MEHGTVKWFNDAKGYGFIQSDGGEDVFVHYSDVAGEGYRSLKEGERVSYQLQKTARGLKAVNVERLKEN